MHLGIIEQILQRSERDPNIGVIEVSHGEREKVHDKKVINPKPNHRERHVFEHAIHHIFHPVVSQMGGKTHLLHAVVHLVELP